MWDDLYSDTTQNSDNDEFDSDVEDVDTVVDDSTDLDDSSNASENSDTTDSFDAPLEEETIDTVASDNNEYDSDYSDTTNSLEEESFDDVQGNEDVSMDGPVLRRDPDEFAEITARTLLQRADVMRDDLRDKGWEDGPEMEEYIESQMQEWKTDAANTYLGDTGTPEDEVSEEDTNSDNADLYSDNTDDSYSIPEEETLSDNMQITTDETNDGQQNSDDTDENDEGSDQPFEVLEEETDISYDNGDTDLAITEGGDIENADSILEEEQMEDTTQLSDSDDGMNEDNINENDQSEDYNTLDNAIDTDTIEEKPFQETDNSVEEFMDASSTDTSPDVQGKVDNADVQDISDVSQWIGEINPNFDEFDPESPYCNNCGSCAFAVYQRLEGDTTSCASAENIGYNDEMNALTGMEQVSMSPEEIEQRLLSQGNGAHAIIGIDRAEGPGHWFNAACMDGKVVAIDGQTGEITDWPPDYGDVVNWEMSVRKDD